MATAVEQVVLAFDTRGVRRVRRDVAGVGADATRSGHAVRFLQGAISSLGLALSAREFIRLADSATRLGNQIRLVTTDQRNLNRVMAEVFSVSRETRSGLEATTDLYSRLQRSARTMNLSQQEVLDLTTSVSQAFRIFGNTADEAEAAMVQFSQGLAAGALRGDELRSVLEQAPRLAQAIADGLNEIGEDNLARAFGMGFEEDGSFNYEFVLGSLRRLGAEGELTAERVIRALQTQAQVLREEFGRTIPTIEDGFIQIRNAAIMSMMDPVVQAITSQIARMLIVIADNFDIVSGAARGLAAALGVALAARAIPAVISGLVMLTAALATNPIFALLTAISAGVGVIVGFGDRIDGLTGSGANLRQEFTALIATVGEYLVEAFDFASQEVRKFFSTNQVLISDIVKKIREFGERVYQFAIDVYSNLSNMITNFIEDNRDSIEGIARYFMFFFNEIIEAIPGIVRGFREFWDATESIRNALGELVRDTLSGLLSMLNWIGQKLIEVYQYIQPIIEALSSQAWQTFLAVLRDIGDDLDAARGYSDVLNASMRTYERLMGNLNSLGREQIAGLAVQNQLLQDQASDYLDLARNRLADLAIQREELRIQQERARLRAERTGRSGEYEAIVAQGRAMDATLALARQDVADLLQTRADLQADQVRIEETYATTLQATTQAAVDAENMRFDNFEDRFQRRLQMELEGEAELRKAREQGDLTTLPGGRGGGELGDGSNNRNGARDFATIRRDLLEEIQTMVRGEEAYERLNQQRQIERELRRARSQDAKGEALQLLDLIEIHQRTERVMRREAEVFENIRGPQRDYNDGLTAINNLLARGELIEGTREHADAVRDLNLAYLETQTDGLSGFRRAMMRLVDETSDMASQVEDAWTNAFQGMEDALVNFVRTGRLEFGDLVDSIAEDILRIAIRQEITNPLAQALGLAGDREAGATQEEGGQGSTQNIFSQFWDQAQSFSANFWNQEGTGFLNQFSEGLGSFISNLGGVFGSLLNSFGSLFSNLFSGLGNLLGGLGGGGGNLFGSIFGALKGFLPGFATGGSFTVGGAGGVDSQLVAFRATPGEMVNIRRPGQSGSGPMVFNLSIDARGAEIGVEERVDQRMRELAPLLIGRARGEAEQVVQKKVTRRGI